MAVSPSTTCLSSTSLALPRGYAYLDSLASPFQLRVGGPSFGFHARSRTEHFRYSRRDSAPVLRVLCASQSRATIVTKDSWERSILKSGKPVLVEFYASWCGPCRMVHRMIDEIAREYARELDCFVLNTDNDLAVAEDYEIKAVPVVLLFKDGEKRESIIGTMPKKFYTDAIDRVLRS